jgi:secreted protein with Ig-like and vWFA domain
VISTAYPEVTAVVSVLDIQAAVDAGVGMVMDTSGSMKGDPLSTTQEAAVAFVDSLLPNDKATVIAFADSVGPPSDLTGDRQALASVLRDLQANGATGEDGGVSPFVWVMIVVLALLLVGGGGVLGFR